jgi:hypothetical protein
MTLIEITRPTAYGTVAEKTQGMNRRPFNLAVMPCPLWRSTTFPPNYALFFAAGSENRLHHFTMSTST